MKRINKKVLVIMVILILIFSTSVTANENYSKDETIYGILDYNGSISNIYVVNRLVDYKDNMYIDYGEYSEIKNLSTNTIAQIEGDKIIFHEKNKVSSGLYYQGTIKKELPYNISILYYIDGMEIDASKLANQDGQIEIKMQIEPNLYCEKQLRDGYMVQATITLDLSNNSNIVSSDSTNVIVGNQMTLTYVVLPGDSEKFNVTYNSVNFTLAPINITFTKSNMMIPDSIGNNLDSFNEGFDEIISGMKEIDNGGYALELGIKDLVNGIYSIDEGLLQLAKNGNLLLGGLTQFESGINSISNGSEDILNGIDELLVNGNTINGGLSQLAEGTSELVSNHEQLLQLANTLINSNDPNVRALAQGVLGEYEAIKVIEGTTLGLLYGMNEYMSGIDLFKIKYDTFNNGLKELNGNLYGITIGFNEYINGVNEISNSLDYLYSKTKNMPEQVSELTTGQSEMVLGLETVKNEIGDLAGAFESKDLDVVSFISSKNNPNSVQYILTTKLIESMQVETEAIEKEDKQTFFERIINLFKF